MAQTLGTFLAGETRGRFGASHAELTELPPFAAKLALECIGNSDALYHNIEHSMLVTLVDQSCTGGGIDAACGGSYGGNDVEYRKSTAFVDVSDLGSGHCGGADQRARQ
jgi:hypothetical protein